MDNSAWFTQQLQHWRDCVAWKTERALAEIAARETDLYGLWTDQAARDYRSRYGMLKEEAQSEIVASLGRIAAALESLQSAITDITNNTELAETLLSKARTESNRVNTHIEAAYRHIGDYELHANEVENTLQKVKAEMQRALMLLEISDTETVTQADDVTYQEALSDNSEVSSSVFGSALLSETPHHKRMPLWPQAEMHKGGEYAGLTPFLGGSEGVSSFAFGAQCALSTGNQGYDAALGAGNGLFAPSWAFRDGDSLVFGFGTSAPPGAMPFLGTSPASATSYLPLRLGSDSKWSTPLGFGSLPRSYDLKLGTCSLSLCGSALEYGPPISISTPRFGLSTGGTSCMNSVSSIGAMTMDYGVGGLVGSFGGPCCLSS